MTRTARWTWSTVSISVGLCLGIIILNGCASSRAAGVQADGRLAPCPSSPNCVCSQDPDSNHLIEGIPYQGSAADAHRRLLAAIGTLPRMNVLTDQELTGQNRYLHVTATSLIMRFTDDVELLIEDATKRIEVRSLSRVGYSDMGVNRRRVNALRKAFAQTP